MPRKDDDALWWFMSAATVIGTPPTYPEEQPETDPYWSSVTLLIGNDNATNGTTTFDDQSANNLTITVGGDTAYSNVQAPSGMTTSIVFDGTGDYLTGPDSAAFGFGTGDFAIDFWVRVSSGLANFPTFLDLRKAGSVVAPVIYAKTDGTIAFFNNADRIVSSAGAIVVNTNYHVALARESGNTRMYVNGTQVGSTYVDAVNYGSSQTLTLGTNYNNLVTTNLTGYLAAYRITKGSSRGWNGASITVPTWPLPTS